MLTAILSMDAVADGATLALPASGGPATGVVDVIVPGAWLVALCALRPAFGARVAPGAWVRAVVMAAGGFGAAVAAGWVLAVHAELRDVP